MTRLRIYRVSLIFLFLAVTVIAAPAQSVFFTSLASFNGADGEYPLAGLIQATDGNFYGTTIYGGANGLGAVFKITPAGTVTTLYSFCSQPNCTDGYWPATALVQASNGNFYGTTREGGANHYGSIFEITPSGTLTTLYSFCPGPFCTDGLLPNALVQASDGSFYGTTGSGGTNNNGTVFRITSGTLTTLYTFCSQPNCTDGGGPSGALVQATDGNFYGTTWQGGAYGYGTVFEITPSGTLTTLHNFRGLQAEGARPAASLVQGSDGNFYGTTQWGGAYNEYTPCNGGCGTVFKITPAGTLTTLHSFDGLDGSNPEDGLVQASDGNFYGTTYLGGVNNSNCIAGCGTVFKIAPAGAFTTLHSFDGSDGGNSIAGLVQATNGNLYGTTQNGGGYGYGTVFRLDIVHPCTTCRP